MKVKIGPYLNWWGPYQIFGLLNKVGVSKDTTDDWAKRSPEWFADLCQWIYNKRHRRIKIKIHNYDTWSMDATLAIIILPMLKQLKATKHGSPHLPVFDQTSNSAQSCFDFYEEGDETAWEVGHAQWEVIMDEMIWAFEQLQPDCDWEAQYCSEPCELDMTEYPEDEGKTCVPVRWKTEGKYDWEGMRAHQARISAAMVQFGTYFESLWD
jgi:hypothetical protein